MGDVASKRCDPVGTLEIAQRLGVRQQTVAMWKLRGLLPAPAWSVSGNPAWDWPDIERWARDSGRLKQQDSSERSQEPSGRPERPRYSASDSSTTAR